MRKVINFIGLDELLNTDAPKYSQFRRSPKKKYYQPYQWI